LRPTAGEVHVEGRVAAILELGSAMNPDFTGRENARLLAAVAGLGRPEIERRLGDILAFADIGEFVDQPVKVYSSGMLLRIAIAVALATEPDVLVVDEVLAVGDEPFQRKCFARLEALRRGGATVLFASHDATTVMSLCDAVLLLDRGEALLFGEPKHVVERYLQLAFAPAEARDELRDEIRRLDARAPSGSALAPPRAAAAFDPGLRSQSAVHLGPNGAEILDPRLETLHGDRVNVLVRGETYRYRYRVRFDSEHRRVRFGMLVKTKAGFELGGGSSSTMAEAYPHIATGSVAEVEFRFACRLLPGTYFLNAGVVATGVEGETYLHRILDAVAFRVRGEGDSSDTGIVDFGVAARVEWPG
jgi:lipopolysaccharide transport system ATP-binding protein